MSTYTAKTWADRVVENPMTFTMVTNLDSTVTLTPAPGTVITVGDLVKAEYLNAMELGIQSAHQEIELKANIASPTFTGTPAAPTAAADTNTTQLATTAFVVGQAGSSTPQPNGTAAAGTSKKYSREDHVHAGGSAFADAILFGG